MSAYVDKYNFYNNPAMDGDSNWEIEYFVSDIHKDSSNRIYLMPEEMRLESLGLTNDKGNIIQTFLFTRKKTLKIVETNEHHYMSRPKFEKDQSVSTAHVILIAKPPYEGTFKERMDMEWKRNKDKIYTDYKLYYESYGYTIDIDYWLPRLRQYLHARYF